MAKFAVCKTAARIAARCLLAVLLPVVGLTACGLKGDLVLPAESAAAPGTVSNNKQNDKSDSKTRPDDAAATGVQSIESAAGSAAQELKP